MSEGEPGEGNGERIAPPFYNWMSVIGALITIFFGTALLFFLTLGIWGARDTGYSGLTLIPIVAIVLFGLCLVLAGWLRERRRIARGVRSSFFETITVDPWSVARGVGPWVVGAIVAGVSFAMLSAGAGSLAVVEYSESNEFCSDACHSVMAPEAVTWQQSPHSRIHCTECHVAPGAEGFIRAKIGGTRQLVATLTGNVPRPIHTPIDNGVLSEEVCQRCHPVENIQGYHMLVRRYFLGGEDVWNVRLAMALKVGANHKGLMSGAGIHYHMQLANRIEYKARDAKRQEIAWVRVTSDEGEVTEYERADEPLSEEEQASLETHTMNCLDCHNRVAHPFAPPVDSVNAALDAGELPTDLPYVKQASVRALDGDYETSEAAHAGIEETLRAFYEDEDPDILEDEAEAIATTVERLRGIYQHSIFPEMQADWRTHPNNASHRDFPGCFRCHNDEMVDAEGNAVFSDCSACHTILAGEGNAIESVAEFDRGRDFVHPEDFSTLEEYTECWECHTGGQELYD